MHQIVEREREFVWYCMFYHNDGEDARIIAMCKEVVSRYNVCRMVEIGGKAVSFKC